MLHRTVLAVQTIKQHVTSSLNFHQSPVHCGASSGQRIVVEGEPISISLERSIKFVEEVGTSFLKILTARVHSDCTPEII